MKAYKLIVLSCIYCWTIVAVLAVPFFNKQHSSTSSSSSSSHPSSLLLQHHRTIYTNRQPHDTSLYDILNVRPNATLVEIQKSWRRKSLLWHPDKVAARRRRRRRSNDNDEVKKYDGRIDRCVGDTVVPPPPPPPPPVNDDHSTINRKQDGPNESIKNNNPQNDQDDGEEEYARNQLQKLQHAYEILSNDHNRLLYHKYGLIGGSTDAAVQLLTGRAAAAAAASVQSGSSTSALHNADGGVNSEGSVSAEQIRLLELMGYHHAQQQHHAYPHSSTSTTTTISHEQRIQTLTTTITEYLRPLVEGTISQEHFITQLHSEMNTLKKSPLGAQIVRCVGRAYKVEGWRVLRSMREEKERYGSSSRKRQRTRRRKGSSHSGRQKQNSRVDDILQDSWRNTKHYASAALASGKLVLMEQKLKKMEEDRLRERTERLRRRKKERERMKRIEGGGNDDHLFSSNIGSLSDDTEEDEEFDIGSFSDIDNNNYNDSDSDMMMFSSSESEEEYDDDEIEYELQHIQNQKTYTALLSLHQMEALWKVTKIELDKTVREACRWILMPTSPPVNDGSVGEGGGGWYAFCPSEQSPYQEDWQHYHARPPPPPPPPPPPSSHHDEHERYHPHKRRHRQHQRDRRHSEADGWVGLNGEVVPMEVGRLRAAAAMVLVGDIMVQCSKEGTAWRKKK